MASKLFLPLSFIVINKVKIHEETLIVNIHFDITWTDNYYLGALQSNKHFQASHAWENKMIPRFQLLPPSFTEHKAGKNPPTDFFSKYAISYLPKVFKCFKLNYYVWFSKILKHSITFLQ